MQRPRRYIWVPLLAVLVVGTVATAVGAGSTSAARRSGLLAQRVRGAPVRTLHRRWVAAWSASPQPATHKIQYPTGFADETVRNVIYSSAGGDLVRVQLSNAYGTRPVAVRAATIGHVGPRTSVAGALSLRFGGSHSVVIPAGRTIYSDPLHLAVHPLEPLAVSVFLPRPTGLPTDHGMAREVNLVAKGDHVFDPTAARFQARTFSWYYVTRLDVRRSPRYLGAVVAFGDSITDGAHSSVGGNARWPNDLARRLDALRGPILSVVDAGISGNRLLTPSKCCGNAGVGRFRRDALGQSSVRAVIVLEGVNDLGATRYVTVQQVIDGYKHLIQAAHAAGVRIFGATLTPFKDAGYWTPGGEVKRDRINAWIRHSHAFDGVVDFAAAVSDPRHPDRYLPAYDSGDHLHPNNAGYRAMARAINLAMLLHAVGRKAT